MPEKIHLVIPDSHAHPDENNKRFEWLGQLILDLRPDVLVNIGDQWDMASLSGHSSKKELEGKRYADDIAIGVDASERILAPLRKAKKKHPRKVFCLGNHEERILRLIKQDPKLEGVVSLKDLQLKEYGWEVHDFLTPAIVDGIAYAHYFTSGVMGRPIGGDKIARSILNKKHMSCTQGHDHTLDYALATRATGQRIQGLDCGVFQDFKTGWNNAQSEGLWWSGVVIKRHVVDGTYDPEFVSIGRLKAEYGT